MVLYWPPILSRHVWLEGGVFFQKQSRQCYPRLYDTKIVNENGEKIVNGCNVTDIDNSELSINGIPLYHPTTYRAGSSLSHQHV